MSENRCGRNIPYLRFIRPWLSFVQSAVTRYLRIYLSQELSKGFRKTPPRTGLAAFSPYLVTRIPFLSRNICLPHCTSDILHTCLIQQSPSNSHRIHAVALKMPRTHCLTKGSGTHPGITPLSKFTNGLKVFPCGDHPTLSIV